MDISFFAYLVCLFLLRTEKASAEYKERAILYRYNLSPRSQVSLNQWLGKGGRGDLLTRLLPNTQKKT